MTETTGALQFDTPAAPSNCRVTTFNGGRFGVRSTTVSWKDNSDNETGFTLEVWTKVQGQLVFLGSIDIGPDSTAYVFIGIFGAGLEIDFQSETDVVALGAHKTRHEEWNYRVYQFAGAAHIRDIDVAEFGLRGSGDCQPGRLGPFFRGLFVAGDNWCEGIQPPPSIWLGAPNDPTIVRDTSGNALVRFVGGEPVDTIAFRLPEVAVGQNQYIPLDPSYDDGSFLGFCA